MDKRIPFYTIWENINNNTEIDNKVFCLKTLKLGIKHEDLFELLRRNKANYIYIKGISHFGKEATGLLCIDEDYNFATIENCFFVGNLGDSKDISFSALELFHFLGEDAKYMGCKVILTEKEKVKELAIDSFLSAIEEMI